MRFWDRITGGAASVTIELDRPMYLPGQPIAVRATISASSEVEIKSALVTLRGQEEVRFEVPRYDDEGEQIGEEDEYERNTTVDVDKRIPGPIELAEGQQHVLEAELHVPMNAPPTYAGPRATHTYKVSVELDVAWSANPGDNVDVIIGMEGPRE